MRLPALYCYLRRKLGGTHSLNYFRYVKLSCGYGCADSVLYCSRCHERLTLTFYRDPVCPQHAK
jgi:hypothetical protein